MDKAVDKTVSRRTVLGGGLKAAVALGAGSGVLSLLGDRASAQAHRSGPSLLRNAKSTGKLTVAILGNAASNAVALKAFKAFQNQTGITTTPLFINVPTWVDFFEQIETRLIAGVEIDTMNLATEGFRLFASKGVLAPLDSFIGQDKAVINSFYADMNQRTLTQFRQHAQIDGHTYYIPWGYNTMGIWYNRATFKAGKVSEPSPDWTWDDFFAAATALTKAPQNWGMNLTIDVFQGIEPWVFTNGGQVLNNAWTSVVIDNPAAVEACAFARSLVAKNLAPSPGGTFNQFSALGQGHLAMMGAGIWPWNYYVENGGGRTWRSSHGPRRCNKALPSASPPSPSSRHPRARTRRGSSSSTRSPRASRPTRRCLLRVACPCGSPSRTVLRSSRGCRPGPSTSPPRSSMPRRSSASPTLPRWKVTSTPPGSRSWPGPYHRRWDWRNCSPSSTVSSTSADRATAVPLDAWQRG